MERAEVCAVGLPLDRDAAVTALFRTHYARMLGLARLLVDDRSTAEDVVQEAFGELHRRWDRLRDPEQALGYLRTAVLNGARSHLRRRRTLRAWRPQRPADAPSAESVVVHDDEQRRALQGLVRLPQRQREVLVLRYFFDLPEAQIAADLGISAGSVKQHAFRGLSTLAARLQEVAP